MKKEDAKRNAVEAERDAKAFHSRKARKNWNRLTAQYHEAAKYRLAAEQWIKGGYIKNAYSDFRKASNLYNECAKAYTGEGGEITNETFNMYADKSLECNRQADRLKKVLNGKWHGLEGKAVAAIFIVGLITGIFFLSSNITGNVIGSQGISNGIGAVLLVVGLVVGFFWLKSKK